MARSLRTRFRALYAAATAVSLELVAAVLNGSRLTVSRYLAMRRMPADFIAQYASAFGRATAKAYRAANDGAAPAQGWTVRGGKLRPANVYRDTTALDAAFATYARTRTGAWKLAA